ncbi:SRPBCC family protein [Hydrogenophaga sp.]|uniref:SRPBCC family protein n=1 Tax=Hydrogenophaga sp. TaxID=1904254 RepID=UPI00271DA345|nr:SRPBCC family protein [Hydrogenophaga sp.]MDO9433883.1 SRPBCC family protein [Hydrogenophaga sp.]
MSSSALGPGSSSANAVQLHRVLRAPPEKVYRAFLDAGALARWLPPYGFLCEVHHLDAKVGGTFKMSFRNFSTGHGHSFGGEYLELVPGERIRYTDKFDDANLPGVMSVDVQLKAVSCGTELTVVQSGIPAVIPLEMCYLGWQESLVQLAHLVEPDIPDGA